MEEKLKYIFSNVNDWLKYSEAKNGVLLALNGGIIMGIFSLLKDISILIAPYIKWLILPCFMLSLIILLISFLPIRDKFFKRNFDLSSVKLTELNLFYFGDLKYLTTTIFLKRIYEAYNKDVPNEFPQIERNLANQILNNSTIADRKLTLFTISAYIDFAAVIITIIVLLSKTI